MSVRSLWLKGRVSSAWALPQLRSGESFGPSPRFQDILSELVAAHVEEAATDMHHVHYVKLESSMQPLNAART